MLLVLELWREDPATVLAKSSLLANLWGFGVFTLLYYVLGLLPLTPFTATAGILLAKAEPANDIKAFLIGFVLWLPFILIGMSVGRDALLFTGTIGLQSGISTIICNRLAKSKILT